MNADVKEIADLHNRISDQLGVEWGSGWSYEWRDYGIRFSWREQQMLCQCEVHCTDEADALRIFSRLLDNKAEYRKKKAAKSALPPLQRQTATRDELNIMQSWFGTHEDIYNRHFARRLSQTGTKRLSSLTADEQQMLYRMWQEYLSVQQQNRE